MPSPAHATTDAPDLAKPARSAAPRETEPRGEPFLERPLDQRRREYKYRCAQSVVFGLPVLFLEYFGHALGGPEAGRWVAILQALLAGWVAYVGAAGMLFEGALRAARGRVTLELLVASVAMAMYLWSAVSTLGVFIIGAPLFRPLLFHLSVILIAIWTGARWYRLAGKR